MKNFLRYIIILSLFFYLFLLGYVYFNQRNLLYHPSNNIEDISYYDFEGAQEIIISTQDGVKLQAWYKNPQDGGLMVVFFHGNAGNIADRIDKLKALAELGDGFIIPSWRGFGKSEGHPTKDGLLNDAEATLKFLKSNGYDLKDIIMIGESLGTGIATKMATNYKFKGLLLLTPYTSIADRAGEIYPFLPTQLLTKDNFEVLSKIDLINQPLLIIHGDKDDVVPLDHAMKIYNKAKEKKKIIIYPGAGHSNYNYKDAFANMQEFFK